MRARAVVGIVVAALVASFVLGTASCSDDDDADASATDAPLVAAFTFEPDYDVTGPTSCPLRDVTFTDASTGDPDGWEWEFSDGSTSTEPDPVVTEFIHEATLTVTRGDESDSVTKPVPLVQC